LEAQVDWAGEKLLLRSPLVGRHNLANLLAAAAAGLVVGLSSRQLVEGLASFPGVRRRLEVVGEAAGVTVVDDFAHHPTAVNYTLQGARHRFPGRRLVVAFEPRSLTAGRAPFFSLYQQAFQQADVVILAPVYHRQRLAPQELLDRQALAQALRRAGRQAIAVEDGEDPLPAVLQYLRPGDVCLVMSSGDFGGLPQRILQSLGKPS
jgi:UDP-N-acetylmuramate: L-alanyl-gamma-D-glutamyl-meso-diaminopimelate ligase